jgi:hypothetical protein
MSDRRLTNPGTPSSHRLAKWSMLMAWMASDPDLRYVEIRLDRARGLIVRVTMGQMAAEEVVKSDEDPSTAALRAMSLLSEG